MTEPVSVETFAAEWWALRAKFVSLLQRGTWQCRACGLEWAGQVEHPTGIETACPIYDIDTLLSASPRPAGGWQPIESAPKEGRFLAWLGDDYVVCILGWGEDDFGREAWLDDDDFAPDPQPTHWMPLPVPPRSARTT